LYVDDFFKSVSTEEEAISVVQEITDLCSKGGFKLAKWICNSRKVLQSIPLEEQAKELKDLDLAKDDLPSGRALGIKWCTSSDQFGFRVSSRDLAPTRRNLLSVVCSIFDPLGFVSPFSMRAKMFLQKSM
jgi:hypothetical protein